MRNFCFIIFLVICTNLSLVAQITELRFTGEDRIHSYVRLDKVEITNYTQSWTETIFYPDTVLIFNPGTGITTFDESSTSFSGIIPNPSYGISYINVQVVKEEHIQLSIFDVQGKKITELQQLLPVGKHTLRVYLSTPQIYLLKLTMGNIQHTFKIINISNGGQEKIEYYSANLEYPMVYSAGQGKGNSQNPFNIGDNMGYLGYATINGEEFISVPIEQIQNQSENFTLLFDTIVFTLPTVTTAAISNITSTSATGGGNVTFDGNTNTMRGICWSTSPNPTLSDSYTVDGIGMGVFASNITGLTANITYYVRAYATNSIGTAYGNEVGFTTYNLPTVTTAAISNITSTDATGGGNVTFDGNTTVTARGVCWSTSPSPTLSDSFTVDGNGLGVFTSSITGLTADTIYYVRAYATNTVGTAYGNAISFTTYDLPAVTTVAISNITSTGATGGGNVTFDGNTPVTARGVCWSISPNPTISDSHTTNGSGLGAFTSNIPGLASNTTYYVRAYATNSVGTAYGNAISFTTYDLPIVTTAAISNITSMDATGGGNVTSDGHTTVTARGVCWSTSPSPTLTDSYTVDGSGLGVFTSSLTVLTSNTTYYVRAYATNSVGTAYGNAISFTTYDLPIVTTAAISNITSMDATGGGNVTSDGHTTVTARGVCWSTSPSPTLSDSYTVNGTGLGTFTSSLTVLTANTTYYVRAYATNSVGTAYGNAISFTTYDLPIVTTAAISNITLTDATGGGNVTFNGNTTVTARGVCWSTSPSPTLSDSYTVNGIGLGTFTSSLTVLTANTTYYVRAYATNSVGTAYGNEESFTTLPPAPCSIGVTDIDGNHYDGIEIGTQCWMKQNLRVTKYATGTSIPLGIFISTSTSTPYRYNPNDDTNNVSTYGYLYNWPAAMNGAGSSSSNPSGVQGVCPDGWHLPSDAEWTQLTAYVVSQPSYHCGSTSTYIAKALASTWGWNSSTTTCAVGNTPSNNNTTGFGAVPAGYYYYGCTNFGYDGHLWSATEYSDLRAINRDLFHSSAPVQTSYGSKYEGFSVRCLRD